MTTLRLITLSIFCLLLIGCDDIGNMLGFGRQRYQIVFGRHRVRDTFLIDTKYGRIWQSVVDKNDREYWEEMEIVHKGKTPDENSMTDWENYYRFRIMELNRENMQKLQKMTLKEIEIEKSDIKKKMINDHLSEIEKKEASNRIEMLETEEKRRSNIKNQEKPTDSAH